MSDQSRPIFTKEREMLESVNYKVSCKCGETSHSVVPDANNRIFLPEPICMKCKSTCEVFIPEPKPETKAEKKAREKAERKAAKSKTK